MVGRMEGIPEDISGAFQDQKTPSSGSPLTLFDIVKILLAIMSSQAISMCVWHSRRMCGSETSQAPSFAALNLLEAHGRSDICNQEAPHTVRTGIIEIPARM